VIEAILDTGMLVSEPYRGHTVVTTDAADFRIYRRFTRQPLVLRVP
jgi:hypothetical protein